MTKLHFRPYISNQTLLFPSRIDEDIAEDEHVYLQKTLHKLAEQEPYFNVLADELNQELDAKVANDALYLLNFWQEIHEVEDLKCFNLLNVVNGQYFQTERKVVWYGDENYQYHYSGMAKQDRKSVV